MFHSADVMNNDKALARRVRDMGREDSIPVNSIAIVSILCLEIACEPSPTYLKQQPLPRPRPSG